MQKKINLTSLCLSSLILAMGLFIFGCKNNGYPKEIQTRNLQEKYDFAKWIMYVSNFRQKDMHCRDEKNNIQMWVANYPFEFDICFEELQESGDTLLMKLSYFVYDSCKCSFPQNSNAVNSIFFIGNDSPKIYRCNILSEKGAKFKYKPIIDYYLSDSIPLTKKITNSFIQDEVDFIHTFDSINNVREIESKWIMNYIKKGNYKEYHDLVVY